MLHLLLWLKVTLFQFRFHMRHIHCIWICKDTKLITDIRQMSHMLHLIVAIIDKTFIKERCMITFLQKVIGFLFIIGNASYPNDMICSIEQKPIGVDKHLIRNDNEAIHVWIDRVYAQNMYHWEYTHEDHSQMMGRNAFLYTKSRYWIRQWERFLKSHGIVD